MFHARDDYNRLQDPDGKIPEDEPVFLIRGQDVVAPSVLRHWVQLYREHETHSPSMAKMVLQHANAMEAWQKEHGSKVADLPSDPVWTDPSSPDTSHTPS